MGSKDISIIDIKRIHEYHQEEKESTYQAKNIDENIMNVGPPPKP